MRVVAWTEPMSPGERIARERERTRERLETLAANLVWGAALCESFELGYERLFYGRASSGEPRFTWSPGCGRKSP